MGFDSVLVANRGEIAIRIFRACTELGLRTVAVYSKEDELSLHRYKADEAYEIGAGKGPVAAYLDGEAIVELALRLRVGAIHPGYGFLAENAAFAQRCLEAGIEFVGPSPEHLKEFGDKVRARRLAERAGIPVIAAGADSAKNGAEAVAQAEKLGYPVMVKAVAGGGGRGMRVATTEDELAEAVERARSEAEAAFGNADVYIEKFVPEAKHIEVQVLADKFGQTLHLYERDCSIQRRHQKIVEIAPAPSLSEPTRQALGEAAVRLMASVGYTGLATVEFLVDADENFYFLEVNPRIQVEHTVTELVTGVDLVQAQLLVAKGRRLSEAPISLPDQDAVLCSGVAIQCRITAEDPANDFAPDHGRIHAYRVATGFGVRVDDGAGYHGADIRPHYDSLLAKVCTWDRTLTGASGKMLRALREFRIRGVKTNLPFLKNVVVHPTFLAGSATTAFIDTHQELYEFPEARDRGTRLLRYIGHASLNNGPGMQPGPKPELAIVDKPDGAGDDPLPPGTKQLLDEHGPEAVARWMLEQRRLLVTDTTFRDGHQSLLATRMRTLDLTRAAAATMRAMPGLFSAEVWGGATFDVAYRFLKEDPWARLDALRELMPTVLLQMLLRGANAVGYRNYPDNVVRAFVREAARSGIDLFRVFDSLNWIEAMTVAMETAAEENKIVEAALCYTGDVEDPTRTKYDVAYYVRLAKELAKRGAHVIAIKDMAGLLKPYAAGPLVRALKEATGLPVHLHTHDGSGNGAATILAAVDAGVDAVDLSVASMAGATSQPSLNGIVAALQHHPRHTGFDLHALQKLDNYWGGVKKYYGAFAGTQPTASAEVYLYEIPGGQYTNLWQQADALGLGERWEEVKRAYAEANKMLGDIVKVTPSSKAVGDLALLMVQNDIEDEAELLARADDMTFPDAVIDYFSGMMGQPEGGFPEELQAKVLKDRKALSIRPGETLAPVDWAALRQELDGPDAVTAAPVDPDRSLISYALYPKVFTEYREHRELYADTSSLATPVFFYGLDVGETTSVEIERGKTLIVKLVAIGDVQADGTRSMWFELNGQTREVRVRDMSVTSSVAERPRATPGDPTHVGAPMPGTVLTVHGVVGAVVGRNEPLAVIEAMKMEVAVAPSAPGRVAQVLVGAGETVDAGDLLFVIEPGNGKNGGEE